ncbi:hypothetical protein CEK63_18490 [Xanthomonas sontii]|nr:hypothetical protein CEK63_18490 [Xanthomonas sontii]UZK09101.1 hypothetical protein CJ027_003620 [Xanthomonas sontii]
MGGRVDDILKSLRVDVDNQESDDGYFSLGFLIDQEHAGLPYNIGLCRDEIEDPGCLYIEVDDQIHGFATRRARYAFNGNVLAIELLDDHVFHWTGSKVVKIIVPEGQAQQVAACVASMFSGIGGQ